MLSEIYYAVLESRRGLGELTHLKACESQFRLLAMYDSQRWKKGQNCKVMIVDDSYIPYHDFLFFNISFKALKSDSSMV